MIFSRRSSGESPANWRKWVVPNASLSEVVWDPLGRSGALVRHGDASHLEALLPLEPEEAGIEKSSE